MAVRVLEGYGGGTALGSVQVVPAEEMDALHGMPAEAHGTSVGSLTAAMRAAGKLTVLRTIWLTMIDGSKSFQSPNFPDFWHGLFNFGPLRKLLKKHVSPEDLAIPCYAHAVDLGSKRYNRLLLNGLSRDDFLDALVASSSQVGIHEIAKFKGRKKADGGIRHVLPLVLRPWERFDLAYYISCSPVSDPLHDNELEQDDIGISRALEMIVDSVEMGDFRRLRKWAEQGFSITLVQPQERPGDPFDARPETNAHRLQVIGRAAWDTRTHVTGRPGLHLDAAQRQLLRKTLRNQGVYLDEVLERLVSRPHR